MSPPQIHPRRTRNVTAAVPNVIWAAVDTLAALNSLVTESIDVVVHSERGPDGPRVTEVLAVEDLAGGPDSVQFTTTEVFSRSGPDAPLRWSGLVPIRLGDRMARRGIDLRQLLAGTQGRSA